MKLLPYPFVVLTFIFTHTFTLIGVVTTGDLGRVMRAVGLEPSDDELANMITEVDGSGECCARLKIMLSSLQRRRFFYRIQSSI